MRFSENGYDELFHDGILARDVILVWVGQLVEDYFRLPEGTRPK